MTLTRFFKLITDDVEVNKIQDNLIRTLNPVFDTPILGGNILQEVELTSGLNIINHKLGKNLVGWIIIRKRGSADIYDQQDNNPQPDKTLLLQSDNIVTVDIYVF